MALTESNSFEIGKKAPEFDLMDAVLGNYRTLQKLKGDKGTAIFFICNHCPFVLHINEQLIKIANEYQAKSINFIAISSNDVETYPQDGPDKMKQVAIALNYPFPYLYDETQNVAKAYDATCTPDIYLFDGELKAIYHGQFCDSRPGNKLPVTGSDLRFAMNNMLKGKSPIESQRPSVGCGIKWKR